MTIVKTSFVVVILLVALGACSGQEPVESTEASLLIPATWPIWQPLAAGGYVNSCADDCGELSCGCVKDRCVGDPDGQPCNSIGAICNVVKGLRYEELTCDVPPTWHVTRSGRCFQFCGANNCDCLTSCPAGAQSGQQCSPSGATCDVITNPNAGLVQELHCSH